MAPRLSARLPLAAVLLLLTALWAVPVFVLPARHSGAPGSLELRGSAPASASRSSAGASEPPTGSAGLASLGLVALALAAGMGRPRQQLATPRQFFGGASAPPPSKPTSYKDFQDPWLGSADLSFDPLNLAVQGGIFDTAPTAVPATTYYNYRESEVKHGRFAMTAFLAIFGEAADRGALLRQMGNTGIEDKLDGTLGLDEVQLPILLIGLGYQALAEYNLQRDEDDGNILSVEYKQERMPGDLGFDPLGLGKGKGADIKGLHNIEVNFGRLAMIGITTFLLKEFALKDPEIAAKLG